MFTDQDFISLGVLKRTHNKDLPPFIFVRRDGLYVPFRSEAIASLMGEEIYVLRSDMQEEDEDMMTWQDLVGYTIEEDGKTIGVIDYVDESTINTLATLEDGRMLPLHEDFIIEIDEDARVLRVQLPFVL
jgi:ribosomal 30S subunit maturation factor RimM